MKKEIKAEVQQWIADWDDGKVIRSVCLGGLGRGYEMAIQGLAVELARQILKTPFDNDEYDSIADEHEKRAFYRNWQSSVESHDNVKAALSNGGGMTGAQVGAAYNAAMVFTRMGVAKGVASAGSERTIVINKSEGVVSGDVG